MVVVEEGVVVTEEGLVEHKVVEDGVVAGVGLVL